MSIHGHAVRRHSKKGVFDALDEGDVNHEVHAHHALDRRGSRGEQGDGRGAYGLQAAIAESHAVAPSVAETDWDRIVLLYEALGRLAPNPVVELNRAVAVSMATGPANALRIVDELVAAGSLRGTHLLPSVRGELLARLGRTDDARADLLEAARLAGNDREAAVLRAKAEAL